MKEINSHDGVVREQAEPSRRRIRSFVLRGRMSRSQQSAYEKYRDSYCISYESRLLDLDEVFPDTDDVIAEIGFGMGWATAEIAGKNPHTGYLGIEVHSPGVGKLLSIIGERGLQNIRIIRHDAVEVFRDMIPDASLAGIHLFFPDPWPKKKHHKRRIVQDHSIGDFLCKIRPGGYIYAATDWEEYATHILGVFRRTPGIENTAEDYAERPLWRPLTAFEKKGRVQGHCIREIIFRKSE